MAVHGHMPVGMVVVVAVCMVVEAGTGHEKMLYYNITSVYRGRFSRFRGAYGFPIAMAMAAARNGNGSDTAARNQTKRAGMNGISHNKSR
jgi:hypothetical protein